MNLIIAAQRWTLRAGVFLLPLVYSPFTYDSYVLPKLLFARLLVLALLALWLARIAVTRNLVLKRTPLDVPLLLFLGSAALSWVFAENRNVAWLGTYTRYDGVLTLLTYAALFWFTVQSLADRDEARALTRVLMASGYAVSAIAILQSLHDTANPAGHVLASGGAFVPAYGTLGNPNVLGAFLALIITLAAGELSTAGSTFGRVLVANVLVVAAVAMLLTFSRSAWLGALVGVGLIVATRPNRKLALGFLLIPLGVVAVVAVAWHPALERALTLLDPHLIASERGGIWSDTLRLVATRPILGYGPDNFGLVFPRFQTGDWGLAGSLRQPIDKAHAELLQVAATQGLVGLATYLLLQLAFLRSLWRARRVDQAVVVGAAWIAFQLVVQLNFSALSAALPFWIFTAAAVTSFDAVRTRPIALDGRVASAPLVPGVALAAVIVLWGVTAPVLADARLRAAVDADYAGHPEVAQQLAAEARQLAPWESVYSVEVANVAFEQNDWVAARHAYRAAAELGTFNDLVYRNLALADLHLGLTAEARDAAQLAVEFNRFDPANQALLAEFTVKP